MVDGFKQQRPARPTTSSDAMGRSLVAVLKSTLVQCPTKSLCWVKWYSRITIHESGYVNVQQKGKMLALLSVPMTPKFARVSFPQRLDGSTSLQNTEAFQYRRLVQRLLSPFLCTRTSAS